MKILIIGDQHFKDNLSYAEYVPDGRVGEKKDVLDFIVEAGKDCDNVVFMGDNLNSKNNTSETNREFVNFIERFWNKDVYIISGNHEKKGDGKTAIDFLAEINKGNWFIFKNIASAKIGGLKIDFLPYMLKSEWGVETNEEAVKAMMKNLTGGDILFMHHAIKGFMSNGVKTDTFGEPLFSKTALEKLYHTVIAGHVHEPQEKDRTIITGNIFTEQVGDKEKFIWKIDDKFNVEKIKLPGRPIVKLVNPTLDKFREIDDHGIVKVVLTDKKIDVDEIKSMLKGRFDALLVIEDYPNTRKKAHLEGAAFDFSIEALLKLYSEERGVEYQRLLNGLKLING